MTDIMSVSQMEDKAIQEVPPGHVVFSQDPGQALTSTPIASGIGVSVYDHESRTAAMLHVQKPTANLSGDCRNPYEFADTGMCSILLWFSQKGIDIQRLVIKIVGGAAVPTHQKHLTRESTEDYLGRWNYSSIRRVLWKNAVFIAAEDIGGEAERIMEMTVADGVVTVASQGQRKTL